jgi:hypothetical protein
MRCTPLYTYKHKQRERDTNPPISNGRQKRTEHRFLAEIVTDITTRNPERKDTQQHNTKNQNDEQDGHHQKTGGELMCFCEG